MSNRLRATAVLAVIGIVVISLFSYTQSSKSEFSTLDDYYQQELSWATCYDNYECTDLAVPIDYTDINVGTFQISVLRFSAQDQANRLGSLIVNPGGPGASGVDYAYNAEYIFSPDVTDRYDIVGFDPRGVSESEPIRCFTDAETDENFAGDGKPDSEAEFSTIVVDTKAFIKKCEDKNDHLT